VFYEVGIRHVADRHCAHVPKGHGSAFDVRLSRVVFYKFDDDDLDWEEVEVRIKALKLDPVGK
jgi:hypothetical protein